MVSGKSTTRPCDPSIVFPSELLAEDGNGVDLTLVRSCLRRTPAERLADAEAAARSLEELRDAVERHRVQGDPR